MKRVQPAKLATLSDLLGAYEVSMNTEQIKQEILNRLAAFPNSPIIREVGELVKAIGIADEPFAWATFDGEGGYYLRLYEDNENYAAEWVKVNGKKYDGWVVPLYRQGT